MHLSRRRVGGSLSHAFCHFHPGPHFSNDQLPLLSGWCRWLWLSSAHNSDEDKTSGGAACTLACALTHIGKRSIKSWRGWEMEQWEEWHKLCGNWCVYMTEWVSGCGQGSLGCHRLPPHWNNKARSPPPHHCLFPLFFLSTSAEFKTSCEKRASDLMNR